MEVKELYSKLSINEQNYVSNSLMMWNKRKQVELKEVTHIEDTKELNNLIELFKDYIENIEESEPKKYYTREIIEMSDDEFYNLLIK
jgi:ribosomal 30S subunit maturation factor RimM